MKPEAAASGPSPVCSTHGASNPCARSDAKVAVSQWMFRYPETLGLVLAAELFIGRYTGYRLTELYRFKELLRDNQPSGGTL